jgi:C4-dicarboxylate-specific signal transduction histidine kinase
VESQLRQAQKMSAVGRLAVGVAHDLNNLLTAIIGHADFILARPNLDQGSLAGAEAIVRSAARAANLTRQLRWHGASAGSWTARQPRRRCSPCSNSEAAQSERGGCPRPARDRFDRGDGAVQVRPPEPGCEGRIASRR